jgi:hypothetical protein
MTEEQSKCMVRYIAQ